MHARIQEWRRDEVSHDQDSKGGGRGGGHLGIGVAPPWKLGFVFPRAGDSSHFQLYGGHRALLLVSMRLEIRMGQIRWDAKSEWGRRRRQGKTGRHPSSEQERRVEGHQRVFGRKTGRAQKWRQKTNQGVERKRAPLDRRWAHQWRKANSAIHTRRDCRYKPLARG